MASEGSLSLETSEPRSREFLEGMIAEHSAICGDCETCDGRLVNPCERLLELRGDLNRLLWKIERASKRV